MKINRMRSTRWTYHKKWSFITTAFSFLKTIFKNSWLNPLTTNVSYHTETSQLNSPIFARLLHCTPRTILESSVRDVDHFSWDVRCSYSKLWKLSSTTDIVPFIFWNYKRHCDRSFKITFLMQCFVRSWWCLKVDHITSTFLKAIHLHLASLDITKIFHYWKTKSN